MWRQYPVIVPPLLSLLQCCFICRRYRLNGTCGGVLMVSGPEGRRRTLRPWWPQCTGGGSSQWWWLKLFKYFLFSLSSPLEMSWPYTDKISEVFSFPLINSSSMATGYSHWYSYCDLVDAVLVSFHIGSDMDQSSRLLEGNTGGKWSKERRSHTSHLTQGLESRICSEDDDVISY